MITPLEHSIIIIWKDALAATVANKPDDYYRCHCPLCDAHPNCTTCPVCRKTGEALCCGTPYYDANYAVAAWLNAIIAESPARDIETARLLAVTTHQEEVAFLESLRPETEGENDEPD